ncbi:MAG: glycosyltransferase family 2 protein [Fuerstiella sp.]|nr:glycosyltransferase family 2 protein [Fuerstiella sp.]MCP4507416.1 glycosyltransferase family 2 protein [Fuerstiella sp.]
MPDVSVILPVFNATTTIARAVDSILQQVSVDLELIVVDDGSTDDTVCAVRNVCDDRLKIVRRDHAGVATASNAGLETAQAEVIARMDADDFAYPQKLQKQLEALQRQSLDVIGCGVRILNANNTVPEGLQRYERWINEETATPEQILALRFVEFPLVNPTILAKREYFELEFTDNELPEDYDLMLTAAARGLRFGKLNEVLFDWIDGPSRLTRTDDRYSRDAFMKCRRKHLLHGPLKNVSRVDLWGAGQTGKPWLRWLWRQNIEVRRAYDVHPRKIGRRIHNVPIVDIEQMLPADGTPLLVAVGTDGARALIHEHVMKFGYFAGNDTWFVA